MTTLLIDMDSVICDLMTPWHKRYNEDFDDNLSVERLACWQSEKYVKQECGIKIYDYLDEPGLFRHLEPLPHAIEVLQRLHEKMEILIVTSSRTFAFTEKEQWVNEHLPFIGAKNIIFTHRKDKVYGDVLFDDAPHNLEAFRATGRQAVAMSYPYNQDVDVPHVSDWLQFEKWVDDYVSTQKGNE
ncbi:5' nucleotidase, NT5C type [Priestia koreensis]|uniref:5' nucleotidase, NT5C type n=1 Tax=Priestia koreensis TaxID=284581 RepID=UPI0028F6F818|nr:5'(3')-deoxyribonucleotidase [Priestia koreensis]